MIVAIRCMVAAVVRSSAAVRAVWGSCVVEADRGFDIGYWRCQSGRKMDQLYFLRQDCCVSVIVRRKNS